MVVLGMFFVIMSDGFLVPRIFLRGSSLLAGSSSTQSTSTSTWRNLLRPRRCTIPIAAVASMPTRTFTPTSPKSSSNDDTPSDSVEARTTPYNSDSPELFATTDCVLE